MKKVHLIMPMGGGGTRFGNHGFEVPKPLILLQENHFFYWATQSVIKYMDVQDIIFVVLQEHIDKYSIDRKILEYYPSAIVHVIPQILNGAVLTCAEGIKEVTDDSPVLFNDCDHAFVCQSFYEYCQKENLIHQMVHCSLSNQMIQNTVLFNLMSMETLFGQWKKEAISNEAICGAYYFKTVKYLKML